MSAFLNNLKAFPCEYIAQGYALLLWGYYQFNGNPLKIIFIGKFPQVIPFRVQLVVMSLFGAHKMLKQSSQAIGNIERDFTGIRIPTYLNQDYWSYLEGFLVLIVKEGLKRESQEKQRLKSMTVQSLLNRGKPPFTLHWALRSIPISLWNFSSCSGVSTNCFISGTSDDAGAALWDQKWQN